MKNPIPLVETAGVNASRSSDKQFAQFVKNLWADIFSKIGEKCAKKTRKQIIGH